MPLGRYCSQNCHLMVPAVNKVSVKLDSCQSAWCFLVPSILLFPTPSLSPFPLTPSILPLLHVCLPSALPLTPSLPPWLPTFLPLAPSITRPASFTPSLAFTCLPPSHPLRPSLRLLLQLPHLLCPWLLDCLHPSHLSTRSLPPHLFSLPPSLLACFNLSQFLSFSLQSSFHTTMRLKLYPFSKL